MRHATLLGALPVLLAGAFITATFALTHPTADPPALYLAMARAIHDAGYGLPARVPHFTAGGIPFGFPPFAFYVLAVVHDLLGWSYLTASAYLALVFYVGFAVASYLFARELFRSVPAGIVAGILITVSPAIFRWHLWPSGSVRTPAFLFAVLGLYAGLRMFRTGKRRWLLAGTVLFALTILTHPVYIPFFSLSYLVFYAVLDRSRVGLFHGAIVALGGLALAAPWWGSVIVTHGIDVFLSATSTHGGLGARLFDPPIRYIFKFAGKPDIRLGNLTLWYLTPLGIAYLVAKRRFLLPVWYGVILLMLTPARFNFFIEVLIATAFIVEGVVPALQHAATDDGAAERWPERWPIQWQQWYGRLVTIGLVVAILLAGTAGGADYIGDSMERNTPDAEITRGIEWLRTNTPADASVVAFAWFQGEVAYYGQRTVLTVPWGAEWEGSGAFARQKRITAQLGFCSNATCLTNRLNRFGLSPSYLFLKRGSSPLDSLNASDRYEFVYGNHQVAIYRANRTARQSGLKRAKQ
jgi:hypothetical protein